MFEDCKIVNSFSKGEHIIIYPGNCLNLLRQIPDNNIQLIVTSPPYNINKEYESQLIIGDYLKQQKEIIGECVRILSPRGSLCWQVGNYVKKGYIVPLDLILYPIFVQSGLIMRNRIIWHFEHGLHCKNRFSGRYETVLWFTKTDDYIFNLDPVRIPQKYPGKKYYKGPKSGQYSCNPLGKNPGDVWDIPNVKNNHVEKTDHPCQFPVELIERLILSMTNRDDWVLDPFLGSGTSIIAALRQGRRGIGAEIIPQYINLIYFRIKQYMTGSLLTRNMNTPIYNPDKK